MPYAFDLGLLQNVEEDKKEIENWVVASDGLGF